MTEKRDETLLLKMTMMSFPFKRIHIWNIHIWKVQNMLLQNMKR